MLPFRSKNGWDEEERILKNIKHCFLFISGYAGNKLKEKMVDEQEIVTNLADILAEAYIAESVLLKVQKLEKNKISSLCSYLYSFAKSFNSYYANSSIANNEDHDLNASRIELAKAVGLTLKKGLELLNIPAPSKM